MSILNEITALITAAPAIEGYPGTGQSPPYVASRPLLADDLELALNGDSLGWDLQFSLYCAAASVEASFNLAIAVMRDLQGKRVGGTTLTTSMGYAGAQVEGHYESQVTVQLNQGGI